MDAARGGDESDFHRHEPRRPPIAHVQQNPVDAAKTPTSPIDEPSVEDITDEVHFLMLAAAGAPLAPSDHLHRDGNDRQ